MELLSSETNPPDRWAHFLKHRGQRGGVLVSALPRLHLLTVCAALTYAWMQSVWTHNITLWCRQRAGCSPPVWKSACRWRRGCRSRWWRRWPRQTLAGWDWLAGSQRRRSHLCWACISLREGHRSNTGNLWSICETESKLNRERKRGNVSDKLWKTETSGCNDNSFITN